MCCIDVNVLQPTNYRISQTNLADSGALPMQTTLPPELMFSDRGVTLGALIENGTFAAVHVVHVNGADCALKVKLLPPVIR